MGERMWYVFLFFSVARSFFDDPSLQRRKTRLYVALQVCAVAFCCAGQRLVTGSQDCSIKVGGVLLLLLLLLCEAVDARRSTTVLLRGLVALARRAATMGAVCSGRLE